MSIDERVREKMSLHIGILYHWSPTKNRKSIARRGLLVKRASRLADDYEADYVCLATTPSSGWSLILHPEVEGEWDLWQTQVSESDTVTIRGDFVPFIREVRVHNDIPKDRIWLVASRKAP